MLFRLSLLLPLLLLAACGDLPQPFLGNPGATARNLAQPPTPRLAVPPPADALLSDKASKDFADALATGLQTQEVPAVASRVQQGDWRLTAKVELRGNSVVPVYTVFSPKGEDKGKAEGPPVAASTWAEASAATLDQAAQDAAPKIASLLTNINSALQRADPNSLYNRAAKVQVLTVTGAPGDGNVSLTKQMRTRLAVLGPVVQDTANGADFIVQGQVRVVPVGGGQQRVEIQWIVKTGAGDERGRVVQLNDVPAGTLDHYWADVAVVVAQEASLGVNDVILRQSGREPGTGGGQGQGAQGGGGSSGAPAQPVRGQGQGALLEGPNPGTQPAVR